MGHSSQTYSPHQINNLSKNAHIEGLDKILVGRTLPSVAFDFEHRIGAPLVELRTRRGIKRRHCGKILFASL